MIIMAVTPGSYYGVSVNARAGRRYLGGATPVDRRSDSLSSWREAHGLVRSHLAETLRGVPLRPGSPTLSWDGSPRHRENMAETPGGCGVTRIAIQLPGTPATVRHGRPKGARLRVAVPSP
jgi:hypothetical protein